MFICRYIFAHCSTPRINRFNPDGLPPVKMQKPSALPNRPHPAQGYYNLNQNEFPPFHLLVIK